ncbi:MAG: deoxyribose-phosphate aldolase [Lewinellaceae bacterium]|nr:deoxyribose-phosphate aldolase [Lewinellaceae bacterium]
MTEISRFIEHTILKPDCTVAEVQRICEEAIAHQMGGVCVPPLYVRDARRVIGEESKIRVVTVVGFPMGYNAIAAKSEEIKRAIEDGADELDAVINIAAIKSGNWNYVQNDLDSMARATQMKGRLLKVILECGLLTEKEMIEVGRLAAEAEIPFVKTSTGMHGHPTTPEMVRFLKENMPAGMKIKAAGGIRTAADAQAMIAAGAERIGTSASLAILKG